MKKGNVLCFFNNAYVSGILVGIVLLVVSSLYASWTAKIDFLKGFVFVVTFAVPIWILVALFIIYVIVSRLLAKRPPAYMRYVRDEIQGWTFRWIWLPTSDWRVTPSKLEPICPDCECSLLGFPDQHGDPPKTWCPKCNKPFPYIPMARLIEIQATIVGKARRRFWKTSEKFTNDRSSLPVDHSLY